MLQHIEAVVFDLDGTLIDSMWIWHKIDVEFLEKRNIYVPENLGKGIEGLSFTETAQYFKEKFKLEESIEEIKNEWIEMMKEYYRCKIQFKPGAKSLIELIKSKDIKIGIATSCSRELVEVFLENHKMDHYFDTLVTSCEVARGKPYPDVFLKAAKNLKVEPEKALAFEDTVAGATAAKAAGMKVIAVYDAHSAESKKELEAIADEYIETMELLAAENSEAS